MFTLKSLLDKLEQLAAAYDLALEPLMIIIFYWLLGITFIFSITIFDVSGQLNKNLKEKLFIEEIRR